MPPSSPMARSTLKPTWTLAALIAAGCLALSPAAALAQEDGAPERDSQLPSLTPRVFESRGTVRVSLPDIQRQPLTGFGPPPRQYVVPAERASVTRPFAPDLEALPALVLAPPPEPPSTLDAGHRFRLEGGAGSQLARYGRLDLSAVGAGGTFFVDADYDGVSGGDSFDRVHSDQFDVRAGGQSFATGRLRIEGHALLDRYSTPGSIVQARRTRRAVGAEAGAEGVGRIPYEVTLRFEQARLSRADDLEPETSEGRLDGEARLGLLGDRLRFDVAAGTSGAGGVGTDVQYAAAGASFALDRADGARLVVGLRGLTYDASAVSGGGDSQTLGLIVDLRLPFGESAHLFAKNDPRLAVRSLMGLTDVNPYVAPGVILAPDVLPVDAQAGLELRRGPTRTRAYATGLYAPTYLAFDRTSAGDYAEAYVDAWAAGLGADLTLLTAGGVSASAGLEVRRGRTRDGDDIPYYAPLVGRAGVQVPFMRGRGRVGLAAYGESARPDGFGGADDAPAFGLVSLDAHYEITGPLAAVLRGERLVGEAERWPGFPQAPYAVMLGLRLAR